MSDGTEDKDEVQLAAEQYIKETWLQDPASDGDIYNAASMIDAFYAGTMWTPGRQSGQFDMEAAFNAGRTSVEAKAPHLAEPDVSHETLQLRVALYLVVVAWRDQLVKEMLAAGYSMRRTAAALGIGRPTVYRIIGRGHAYNHGKQQHSMPRTDVSHETKP